MSANPIYRKPKLSTEQFIALRDAATQDVRQLTRAIQSRGAMDNFSNQSARLGYGSSNLLEGTTYPFQRLTYLYPLLLSLYRGNWIVRKIVDAVANDITKKWIKIDTELPPAKLERIDRIMYRTGVKNAINKAYKWARLFGGGACVMVIDGQDFEEPLALEDVDLKSFRGLLAFDRWSGIQPGPRQISDPNNAAEFGMPEYYQVTPVTTGGRGGTFTVHHSRVLRFIGPDVPNWEKQVEQGWGISVVEPFFDALKMHDNTAFNVASLVFRANIFEMSLPQLANILSGINSNPDVLQQVYSTIQAQSVLMSNQGIFISNREKGGGLSQHSYSFGGLDGVWEQFKLLIAGAAEIPYSRIFGRPSGGLGETNVGDEHTYYDNITAMQHAELDPQLQKLIPVVTMSELGRVPDDLEWHYNPVRTLTDLEMANVAQVKGNVITQFYTAGLYGRKTGLQEIKDTLSEDTGMGTNITDEMIAQAEDVALGDLQVAGEEEQITDMQVNRELALQPPPAEDKPKQAKDAATVDCDDARKLTHAQARYEYPAQDSHKQCQTCLHWQGASCQLVQAAEAEGWCKLYKRQEVLAAGELVVIENPVGSVRRGKDFAVTMTWPYGYIKGTEGADGDEVDAFVGPDSAATQVYVVHTQKLSNGKYDEDKLMLNFSGPDTAIAAFLENYSDPAFYKGMTVIPVESLRERLAARQGKRLTADSTISGQPASAPR